MKQPLTRERALEILARELPYLRERYGVVRLALYGSFAHGSPTESSDIDLLVDLAQPLGLEFVGLAHYLEKRLGRKVDLATFQTLQRSLSHPRHGPVALRIQRTLTDVLPTAR